MPAEEKEVEHFGQVFTPQETVSEMISLRQNNGSILEPSAGCGNFVYAIESFFDHPDSRAIELDPKQATDEMLVMDFFDFKPDNKFDTIIGNPPYVRFQDILDETKAKLDMEMFDNRSNLDLFFILRCAQMLTEGGELIFIVPRDFLKATSAKKMNAWLHENGTFTYMHDLGEERIFPGFSPECVIFRWVRGDMSHKTTYKQERQDAEQRTQVEQIGQFLFAKGDYTVPFSDLFFVKVGAVSGADPIFVSEKGNVEMVGSFTAKTGKLKRMFYGDAAREGLVEHKDKLLARRIKKFDDTNWWQYGRDMYHSDSERIYVNGKTRNETPFFYHSCKLYDGSVLAIFPQEELGLGSEELKQLADELNQVDWKHLGFVSGGRFLFSQRSLENVLLPKSFEKWLNR